MDPLTRIALSETWRPGARMRMSITCFRDVGDQPRVSDAQGCGTILAAVGPAVIERSRVPVQRAPPAGIAAVHTSV